MPIPLELRELQKVQRLQQKASVSSRLAAQITIPRLTEPQCIRTNKSFDPLFFINALEALGILYSVKVLTWSIHETGLNLINSWGVWGSIVQIKASPQAVKAIRGLEPPGFLGELAETRTRGRLILVEGNRTLVSVYAQGFDEYNETPWTISSDPQVYSIYLKVFDNA
jgi:hypothetical protein